MTPKKSLNTLSRLCHMIYYHGDKKVSLASWNRVKTAVFEKISFKL